MAGHGKNGSYPRGLFVRNLCTKSEPFSNPDRRSYNPLSRHFTMNKNTPRLHRKFARKVGRYIWFFLKLYAGEDQMEKYTLEHRGFEDRFLGIYKEGALVPEISISRLCGLPRHPTSYADYPLLVLHVGSFDDIDRMRQDAAMWIDGSKGKTRIVILLFVDEGTCVSPLKITKDYEFKTAPSPEHRSKLEDHDDYELRPITYLGYNIVGELTVGVEVWTSSAHGSDGSYPLEAGYIANRNVQKGEWIKKINIEPEHFELPFSEVPVSIGFDNLVKKFMSTMNDEADRRLEHAKPFCRKKSNKAFFTC